MRIGIDARSLLEAEPSGISLYANTLIQALTAELAPEDSLHLFVSGSTVAPDRLQVLASWPQTTVHHLRWPNKLFHTAALAGIAPRIDQQLGGVDVVWAPNLHLLPVNPTVPIVLTVHDLSFRYYPHFLSWRRKLWHTAVRPERLFQRAQQLIAVSHTTAHALMTECQVPAEKIQVIPSGRPIPVAAELVANLPKHFVVIIGTVEPRKNMHTVAQAFLAYKRLHQNSILQLVLIGGSGWKSQRLLRLFQQHDSMHYYGYVTAGQKTFILQQAAALFYPSIYEGFGFPPLEALALGTPVVVGRAGALPEVLQQAAWYINPYSQQELTTMLELFDHYPRRHPNPSSTQWQELNWQRAALDTLHVLRRAVY